MRQYVRKDLGRNSTFREPARSVRPEGGQESPARIRPTQGKEGKGGTGKLSQQPGAKGQSTPGGYCGPAAPASGGRCCRTASGRIGQIQFPVPGCGSRDGRTQVPAPDLAGPTPMAEPGKGAP